MRPFPQIIALCGNPHAGKSEVQKILEIDYQVKPVDDGAPLRDFAMRHLKWSRDDVHTPAGKAGVTTVAGTPVQRRKFLGNFGKYLEAEFGADIMPYMATLDLDPFGRYSFGSVRRKQGAFYKAMGGVVIGVRNPLAPPSGNDFDEFDESLVDVWIDNDAQSRGLTGVAGLFDLGGKVADAISVLRWRPAAA